MNTSENETSMYSEMYDYDYNCNQDSSPEFLDSLSVLFFILFGLGLLGMFKKT